MLLPGRHTENPLRWSQPCLRGTTNQPQTWVGRYHIELGKRFVLVHEHFNNFRCFLTDHGEDSGCGKLLPVPHVRLDGGKCSSSGEGKHDRAEGCAKCGVNVWIGGTYICIVYLTLAEIHWRLWFWMVRNKVGSISIATGYTLAVYSWQSSQVE